MGKMKEHYHNVIYLHQHIEKAKEDEAIRVADKLLSHYRELKRKQVYLDELEKFIYGEWK